MINISRALASSQVLRSLTGLSVKQFDELAVGFDATLRKHKAAERRKRKPQRAAGAGRHHTLGDAKQKLFFTLMYLRVYPTMEVTAFLFDVGKGTVCDWVHQYLPLLEKTLGASQDLPKRRIRSVDEFLKEFPEVKRVIIDSTERPRTRPKDKDTQKSHYSGKKKRHTVKNTVVVDPKTKRALVVGPTVPGPTNDRKDAEGIVANVPGSIPVDVDLGYKGLENEYEGINIPHRKPRNGELSEQQKEANRQLARRRIIVEHRIGHAKRYRSISDTYRNRRTNTEDQFAITCFGLSNFYQRTRAMARA
jgi:hypothetical protein